LANFECDNELTGTPGTGPIAFAALPFDRSAPGCFIVPERLYGHTASGTSWVSEFSAERKQSAAGLPLSPNSDAPTAITMTTVISAQDWCERVAQARDRIRTGALDKVVLSREIRIEADAPFDLNTVADRLFGASPASYGYLVDGFVGASPELLVSRFGDVVRAHPMAGTLPRTGDQEVDQRSASALLASQKNREEHHITISMVHDQLLAWCSYLDAEPAPSVVPAGSVQHLATLVEGRLSTPAPSVLTLIRALHPTPAVAGWPIADALALINELEPTDRGSYAGPVGWVDGNGDGAFAVGLRGATLNGASARCFAGVGVMGDSDPQEELDETRAKFAAALTALTRL
jgi:menaquinone-specific isochorismate synthase